MPDTKRRSDETDLEESRGERDTDWTFENHLWPDDLPDADEVGFAGNVAAAHDAVIDALAELEELNTDLGLGCLEDGIRRLAYALGTEEAGGEVDLKTVQGVEDVLRWLQRSRRLVKQLQTSEAVDQMEKAVAELRGLLDEVGWSADVDSGRGGADDSEQDQVGCPRYIAIDREGPDGSTWRPETPFERIEKAHDRIRGALEAVGSNDNPGSAVGLLMTGAGALGRAASELRERTDEIMIPDDQSLRDIALLLDIEDAPVPPEEVRSSKMSESDQEGRDPVARIVEARDALLERIADDDPQPVWWPSLDLLVRQLNRGSNYTVFNLARAVNEVARSIGAEYGDLAKEIGEAAYELSQEEESRGFGQDSEED